MAAFQAPPRRVGGRLVTGRVRSVNATRSLTAYRASVAANALSTAHPASARHLLFCGTAGAREIPELKQVGRYFKQLTSINVQFGTPDHHFSRYLQVA